jgi:hypothetical protein
MVQTLIMSPNVRCSVSPFPKLGRGVGMLLLLDSLRLRINRRSFSCRIIMSANNHGNFPQKDAMALTKCNSSSTTTSPLAYKPQDQRHKTPLQQEDHPNCLEDTTKAWTRCSTSLITSPSIIKSRLDIL